MCNPHLKAHAITMKLGKGNYIKCSSNWYEFVESCKKNCDKENDQSMTRSATNKLHWGKCKRTHEEWTVNAKQGK